MSLRQKALTARRDKSGDNWCNLTNGNAEIKMQIIIQIEIQIQMETQIQIQMEI